jgi:outer membrane protein assembly factor BamB
MARTLAVVLLTLFVTGCDRLRLASHDIPATTDAGTSTLQVPLEVAWEFDAGAAFGATPFLVVGGNVLVATRQGDLVAIRIDEGTRRGQQGLAASIEGGLLRDGSRLILPMTGEDGGLRAYDLVLGQTAWQHRTGPVESRPVVVGDFIIWADLRGAVHAANRESGEHEWSIPPKGSSVLADLVSWNDSAFVFFSDGAVARIAPEGSLIAEGMLGLPVHRSPLVIGNRVVVPTTRGVLYELDAATLEVVSEHRLAGETVRLTPPARASSDVVVGGADGLVRRVSLETGEIRWTGDLGAAITAAPAVAGDHVIIGTMNGRLVVLDLGTGQVLQEERLRGRIKSAPVVGSFGLLVASEPRHVYRLTHAAP